MFLKSLFWQVVNNIIKIFLEIFVFDRKIRRILKGNWAKFYLRKYVDKGCRMEDTPHPLPSLSTPLTSLPPNGCCGRELSYKKFYTPLPQGARESAEPHAEAPIIWQYWESPDGSIPPLVQACLNSVDKYKGNMKRILLNPQNVSEYVEIPEIFQKLKEKGIIKTAFYSDILRTCLLIQNGGIWIDATVLLTEELPQYITNADLFVFQNDLKIDLDGLNMASYFIAAKPENKILKQTLSALEYYWKENNFLINYFTFLHTFTMVTGKNKDIFKKVPFISFLPVQQFQSELLEPFSAERWDMIKKMSGVHKLTHKQSVLTKNKEMNTEGTFYEHVIKEFL